MIEIIDKKVSPDAVISRAKITTYDRAISETVANIIGDVRARGDKALIEYALKFDRSEIDCIAVSEDEYKVALNAVSGDFIEILKQAADNIKDFHRRQIRENYSVEKDGIVLGQRYIPIEKVGLYVPGGTACYPSSVLMNVIPAKLAGCSEIAIVTPSHGGKVAAEILVAARIAGADKVYKVGGAQAIAALAYGTETVQKVDKIFGPGNAYVAEAKRQVFGTVGIDMVAGPSEILIVSDGKSNAEHLAADLLSQAEHDKLASAVLITDDGALAHRVSDELERQIPLLPRAEIARASIDNRGKIIVCGSICEAIDIANSIAPEHLELCVDEPFGYLGAVKNAGAVFLGRNCPEALGDYFAGTNHTLPTSGTARFSGPLSVDDFIKRSNYIYYTAPALECVADKVIDFASAEGLDAHARSVSVRTGNKNNK